MGDQLPIPGFGSVPLKEDGPGHRAENPNLPEWVGVGSTATQKIVALRGLHPTGRTLHADETLRCRDCRLTARSGGNNRTYIKCTLDRKRWTRGPGSDIRLKWRACDKFEAHK